MRTTNENIRTPEFLFMEAVKDVPKDITPKDLKLIIKGYEALREFHEEEQKASVIKFKEGGK